MMAEVASAARTNLAFGAINLVLSMLTSIVVARMLTTAAYADYATMMAIVSWCLMITEAGGNVGFSRFLKKAGEHQARGTLYRDFLRYRWLLSPFIMIVLLLAGPFWVNNARLTVTNWPTLVFVILGLIVVLNLQGQLGYYAMINSFQHGKALTVAQLTSILKALLLILAAWIMPFPLVLAAAILVVSIFTAWLYHWQTLNLFSEEQSALPPKVMRAAHRHGFVSVFDKFTTAIGNGPFLLIVLAGIYSRPELAMLAVATDFLQKVLGVASIPMGNMVMPYMHRWQGTEYFPSVVRRTGAMGLLVMLPFLGATLTFAPHGLPLLFGERYAGAVAIVLWATVPMYTESWCRMVAGFSLIANGHYKTIMILNGFQGALALVVLLMTYSHGLLAVIIGQGAVQLVMSLVILFIAWRNGLLDGKALPQGLLPATMLALIVALLMQEFWLRSSIGHWVAIFGMACYGVLLATGVRYMVRLDEDTWHALDRIAAGRLNRIFLFVFHKPI